jgi:hypothetical protein
MSLTARSSDVARAAELQASAATADTSRVLSSPLTPPSWVRVCLVLASVQMGVLGASGIFRPGRHLLPLELTALNARATAALYLGATVAAILTLRARKAIDVRIFAAAFAIVATLVLACTLAYWDDFTVDGTPYLWTASYVLDPLLGAFILYRLHLWRAAEPGRHRLTPIFVALAVGFAATGIGMLVAPGAVDEVWPWVLTDAVSRIYGAFFLAIGIGAAMAAWERRVEAILPFTGGCLCVLLLLLVASLLHLSRFAGVSAAAWFLLLAAGAVATAAALVRLDELRSAEAPARPPGEPDGVADDDPAPIASP